MSLIKDLGYKVIDVFSKGKGLSRTICEEDITFPARWSNYYDPNYDRPTFQFIRDHVRKGETVLDLGAHIGLFSVVLSRLVGSEGKVYSFEPTPFTRNVLTEVIELNGCSHNVEVRGEAVSSTRGETVFFDTGDTISNANSLVKTARSKAEIPVKLISVDEFVKERGLKVDFLKIDVEGVEMDVLKGARETFISMRPVASLGVHPQFIVQNGQSLDDIWNVLTDYKMNVLSDGKAIDRAWFCSQDNLFDVNLIPF